MLHLQFVKIVFMIYRKQKLYEESLQQSSIPSIRKQNLLNPIFKKLSMIFLNFWEIFREYATTTQVSPPT